MMFDKVKHNLIISINYNILNLKLKKNLIIWQNTKDLSYF